MLDNSGERRRYPRYDTELKVFFHKKYDLKTRIVYKVISSLNKSIEEHKHSGFSKNISAEGVCFISHHRLTVGDLLTMGIYPPAKDVPVPMEAQVCWQRRLPWQPENKPLFLVGCRVTKVNGKYIAGAIHLDTRYNIIWSPVLDALFHNFAGIKLANDLKKQSDTEED
jgi:hypothetical protein